MKQTVLLLLTLLLLAGCGRTTPTAAPVGPAEKPAAQGPIEKPAITPTPAPTATPAPHNGNWDKIEVPLDQMTDLPVTVKERCFLLKIEIKNGNIFITTYDSTGKVVLEEDLGFSEGPIKLLRDDGKCHDRTIVILDGKYYIEYNADCPSVPGTDA